MHQSQSKLQVIAGWDESVAGMKRGERERGERLVRPVELARHDPPRRRPWRFLRGLLRSAIRSEFRISFSPDTKLVTIEPGLFCSAERALLRRSFRGILLCASAHLSECLVRGDLRGAAASDATLLL